MAEQTSNSPSGSATAAPAASREEIPPLGPNEARLYINNLPWSITNDDLTKWIQNEISIKIIDCSIVQNKKFNRSRGYGFIKIHKNDLNTALSLNGKHLLDRDIGVQEAQQRTDEERTAKRAEQAAKREQIRSNRQANNQSTKSSNQTTKSSNNQSNNSNSSNNQSNNQTKKTEKTPRSKPVLKTYENATTIHLTNLSYKIDNEILKNFIEKSVGVSPVDITIPVRQGKFRTGQSLGFAFVTVPNDKVDATLALNGKVLEERELKVSLARAHNTADESSSSTGANATGGEAQERQKRPPRRNANRRNRGGAAGGAASGDAAASGNADSAASPSGTAAPAKRARGRGRRHPRAGAEEGEAQ